MHPKVSGLDHRRGCETRGVPAELTAEEAAVAEKVVGGLTVGQQDFWQRRWRVKAVSGGSSQLAHAEAGETRCFLSGERCDQGD